MSNDNKRKLYDALSQDYDMGTYEQFCKDIQDEAKRKKLYDATSEAYDYGDYAKFSSQLGFGTHTAALSTTPATPVQDVKPEKQTAQPKQQQSWQPTPMQKAFMSHAVQSEVDKFKATSDAVLERSHNTIDYYKGGGGLTGAPVKGKMAVNSKSGKVEQTYLTPTGTATADKSAAERETRVFNDYVDNMTISGQLRRAERDLDELTQRTEQRKNEIIDEVRKRQVKKEENQSLIGRIYEGIKGGDGMVSGQGAFMGEVNEIMATDRAYRALEASRRKAQERVRTLKHENDRQEGKDVGFWRGFSEVVGDSRTWDFGYGDIQDAITMYGISRKDPANRTNIENKALEQTAEAQAAQATYGQNDSFWHRAGVMTGEMLPFMLDFAIMGGANSGTSAVTRTIDAALLKSLRSAAPKVARNKAAQWTVKALGAMPEDLLYRAPLMTNTVQGMKTASDIIDRKLGDVVVREDGTYDFSNDKTWGSAIWQGEANAIIENYSEMFGTHLEGVLSLNTLGKIAETFGAKRLSGILAKASSSELAGIAGTMQKHLNQLGVSDYFGEVGEEYYGQLWRTMLNLDNAYKQNPDGTRTNLFLDGQFHGDIWGGMALSMGLMGAGKYTLSAAAYGSMKHNVNKTDARASEIFTPEVWEGWRERIDGTTNADIGAMAESIIFDTSLTPEQRDAAMNYMEASLNLRGFNLASVARQRGGEQSAEEAAANESYMDGYSATTPQEMNDAKRMLDLQRQRLASSLSDDMVQEYDADPIGALSRTVDSELRRIASDYVNAKHVYDGLIQRVRDDVDARIAQSDAMIDSRVNRETGMIQPATMKIDDRPVYIVNGNVTMFEDGTGVDTENSSESIIIRDAETGKIEFADPSQVLNIGEGIDSETEKEAARNQITQEIAQAAANKIDGVLSFAPGETYTVLDHDGNPEPITVLGETSDEDNRPLDGFVDIQYSDGTIQTVATSDLQQQVDAANDRRVAQFADERATERAAADEAERQKDETDNGIIDVPSPDAAEEEVMLSQEDSQSSALSQIPTDEQGTPLFESADPETAWDALVEDSEDETEAEEYATGMTKVLDKEVEKARKMFGNVKVTGDRVKYKADKKAARKELTEAEKRLAHWKAMLETKNRREQEAQAAAEAEERRIADERAEHERLERERRDAESRAEAERLRSEKEEREGIPDIINDTPKDARQRGKRRSGTTIYIRQEPITDKVEGKEVTVDFNEKKEGHRPKGRLVVIEAALGQASHMEGKRNPLFFIDEAQPKDRTDAESMLAEQKHAREMDPSLITDSRDMVDPFRGAPTVNIRGEAIQGNHRMAALRYMYAYEPEAQKRYREYLYEHAAEFGFTPKQAQAIAFMDEPILVNMIDIEDTMAIELGQDTGNSRETGGKDRIDADRLAVGIGDKMGRFMDTLLTDDSEDGESLRSLIRRNGLEALKYLRDMGKIDDRQYATAINKDGNLSDEGLEDVEKFIKRTFFAGESREFEYMFDALPAKAQGAVLAQIWRDTKTAEADKLTPHVKEAVKAFYAMQSIPQFKEARTFKDALRAAETWRAQTEFNEEGDIVSNRNRYSNFAIRFAAMMKGSSMKETRMILKQMLDWMQDSGESGLFDIMESEEKTEQDRTFAGAVRKVFDLEYEAGESSPVIPKTKTDKASEVLDNKDSDTENNDNNSTDNDNGKNGGIDVAGNDQAGPSGERGSRRNDRAGKRTESRERTAESGERAGTLEKSDKGNDVVGRSLSEEEAKNLISLMESNAEVAPAIDLTPENWIEQFGEEGKVETPIGTVKTGENQFMKLFSRKRAENFGMIKPTLTNPDVILEEFDPKDGAERDSKYLFIKTFVKPDGNSIVHFESVTVRKDGMEVSISSHEIKESAIINKMQNDKILHLNEKLSPSSEERLTGTPKESEGPDLVPTSDNDVSEDKDNTLSSDKQETVGKSSLGDTALSFKISSPTQEMCYFIARALRMDSGLYF